MKKLVETNSKLANKIIAMQRKLVKALEAITVLTDKMGKQDKPKSGVRNLSAKWGKSYCWSYGLGTYHIGRKCQNKTP